MWYLRGAATRRLGQPARAAQSVTREHWLRRRLPWQVGSCYRRGTLLTQAATGLLKQGNDERRKHRYSSTKLDRLGCKTMVTLEQRDDTRADEARCPVIALRLRDEVRHSLKPLVVDQLVCRYGAGVRKFAWGQIRRRRSQVCVGADTAQAFARKRGVYTPKAFASFSPGLLQPWELVAQEV